jgi:uncharacterized membrane protein YdbT with pleckstrin-like domain
MEMHENEQLIWRGHPSARGSIGWYLKWGFLALLPVIIAGIFKANDQGTGIAYWKWVLLSIGLLVLVVVVDVLRRAAVDYVVTNQRIRIRRGILSRREQSTLIERVQNINTSQRLIERLLGVGTVDFDTAGTEAQEASFRFTGVASPHDLVRRFEAHLTALREAPPPAARAS